MHATRSASPSIEYRFNYAPASGTCPSCGEAFESSIGMWPFTKEGAPVCGRGDCPAAADVSALRPCDTLFEFEEIAPATAAAIRSMGDAIAVSERFRTVSLEPDVPESDSRLLQLAAIDLQYCAGETTRIEQYEPRLVLRLCGEAAGELLLSGCGSIVD